MGVDHLAALCKVWSAAKHFHPYVETRDIDWDAALLEAIPLARAATHRMAYRGALEQLLAHLGDPLTKVADGPVGLFGTMAGDGPAPVEPALRALPGDVRAFVAGDLAPLAGPTFMARAAELWKGLEGARGIVVDLRRCGIGFSFWGPTWLTQLVDGELVLPGVRSRSHAGYADRRRGVVDYTGGFHVADGYVLRGEGGALESIPAVVIVDESFGAGELAAALFDAGRISLVASGPADAIGGRVEVVDAGEGFSVLLRTHELVMPDGSVGLVPDAVVDATPPPPPPPDGDYAADDAVAAALSLLAAPAGMAIARSSHTGGFLTPPARHRPEQIYDDVSPLTPGHRLLGLFRLWGVIRYFFSYLDLMDRAWDDVLVEAIDEVERAHDDAAYVMAIAHATAQLQDTHVHLSGAAIDSLTGTHSPAIAVWPVEGRSVIVTIHDPVPGLAVGDVVVRIDGEDVDARLGSLRAIQAASTPQALEWAVHARLLRGVEGTDAVIDVERDDGSTVTVRAPRTRLYAGRAPSPLPTYCVLPDGCGYIDLTRLETVEVEDAFQAVAGAPALVFDMRGYPRGTMGTVATRLSDEPVTGAIARIPHPSTPNPTASAWQAERQTLPPSEGTHYRGRVAVLIDEGAISQSEHTCLFIEAACPTVTFVGSPTNGANGSVTTVYLPGGINVNFTGAEITFADGRQLQRKGVQPHIYVRPTIAGIRAGKDEVLEAALSFVTL
jgi:hypothetical protein